MITTNQRLSIAAFIIVVVAGLLLPSVKKAAIDLSENVIYLTDMPTSRMVRVRNFTAAGWEEGPTVQGQSLNWPWHFTIDAIGRIYIADRDNGRIVRMDDLAGNGWKIFSRVGSNVLVAPPLISGTTESGNYVSSVFVDPAGRIYITGYSGRGQVVRIDDMDGTNWSVFSQNTFGLKSVVVDRQGRIYFSDNVNHSITRMDDMQGRGLVTLGSFGAGVNQFNEPEGLTIDAQGRIYIADETNHRIVRVNDMSGAGWTTFGTFGNGTGQLKLPHDIQIDNLGRIYIADTGNQRIDRINSMAGDGWVEFGRNGCDGCNPVIAGSFLMSAPKGIRVLGSGPAVVYDAIFPQIAVGGGYRTSIIGVNTGANTVDANITFTRTVNGPPGPPSIRPFSVTVDAQSDSTFTRSVPPMGMMRMSATSAGSLEAGYVTIRSGEELNGVSLFQTGADERITSAAGVALSARTDNFTIYIDNVNNARTGYAIVNAEPAWEEPAASAAGFMDAQLTMTLRDKAGVVLETKAIPLFRGQHLSEFAYQRFPAAAGPDFEGSLEFSTVLITRRLRAVALRYDNPSQDVFTTIPVIINGKDPNDQNAQTGVHKAITANAATTLYYPQVADGTTYRTNFILVNPSNVATTATLEFVSDDGTPLSLPIGGVQRTGQSVSLAPRAVARIVTDGTSSGIKTGWARVTTPTAPIWTAIGGSAIFQTVVNGRITSEAGVSASPLASHFTTPVDTMGYANSGLAICNPNLSNVNLTFNLRNASGQIVASTTRTLVSRAHMAQFLTELFPSGSRQFEGTLEVISSGGPVSGVALRYDSPDGTVFATIPVIVLP